MVQDTRVNDFREGVLPLGGLFKGLFRTLAPVLKSAGKSVARQALKTGLEVADDVVSGNSNLADSMEARGRKNAAILLKRGRKAFSKK